MSFANPDTRLGTRTLRPSGGIAISKPSSPLAFCSAESFMSSHARSSVRMSIDSVLAIAPRPRGCSAPLIQTSNGYGPAVLDVADEHGEVTERMTDHVGPARIAVHKLRTSGPAQARQRRLRRAIEPDAPIRIGGIEVLRLGRAPPRRDLQHRARATLSDDTSRCP